MEEENIPKLDILNGRTIRFQCPQGVIVNYTTNDAGNIVAVNYGETQPNLSIGAQFVFDFGTGTPTNYDIKEIEAGDDERTFMLNSHKLTKATSFLTPVVAIIPGPIGFYTSFVNCYIKKYDDTPEFLVLMYRNAYDQEQEKIFKNLKGIDSYAESVPYGDFFTLFAFKIEDQFVGDVLLFMQGKYSGLSNVLKTRIIRFHKLKKSSLLYKVLYRDVTLKKFLEMDLRESIPDDLDLYSKPDVDIETIKV